MFHLSFAAMMFLQFEQFASEHRLCWNCVISIVSFGVGSLANCDVGDSKAIGLPVTESSWKTGGFSVENLNRKACSVENGSKAFKTCYEP